MSTHPDSLSTASVDLALKKPKYILITNGESYVGYTLAIYIADQLGKREGKIKKKHWRIRVLCENKQNLIHLEERGIDVCQVDYESHPMIRDCMKDRIKTMILTPYSKRQSVINQGRNLLDCASIEKVKRIMMVSSLGCESAPKEDRQCPMRQFYEIEEHLRQVYIYGHWIIFRLPLIQQFMHFWSHMVEHKSVIAMPLNKSNFIHTVNMNDVCECLAQASLSKKVMLWRQPSDSYPGGDISAMDNATSSSEDSSESDEQDPDSIKSANALKRIYELITQPMNISMISKSLTKALRETGFTGDIEPAKMEEDQLESYLKFIAEQGKENSKKTDLSFDAFTLYRKSRNTRGAFSSASSVGKILFDGADTTNASHDQPSDPKYLFPCPAQVLTPFGIQLILDHFRRARMPQGTILFYNDIRDITGHEPTELSDFFMGNRQSFHSEAR